MTWRAYDKCRPSGGLVWRTVKQDTHTHTPQRVSACPCGHPLPKKRGAMDEASEERSQEKVAAEADGVDDKEAPVPERVRRLSLVVFSRGRLLP
jgi:hypothetical protein